MGPLLFVVDWLGSLVREFALWGGVLFLLASVLSFYQGWNQRALASVIEETPRSDISEIRSPGTVRIRGEIVPRAEHATFASPIKGDENCVLSAWEIKELYDTPKTRSWEKSAWGVHAVPFYVSDGTEKILVAINDEVVGNETDDVFTPETLLASAGVSIDGLRCEFEEFDVHVETGYEESPPRRVAEFVENTDGISADPMAADSGLVVDASKRKYLEQTLQSDDEISIIGYATPRREARESTADPGELVLTQAAEATLRLSERPLEEIRDGGGSLLFGALTGVVGIALLATRFVF